jgi:hypothetical protein
MTTMIRIAGILLVLLALPLPPAAAQPPAAGSPVSLDPVAQAAPALAQVPPAHQAEILAWMLSVNDDRRLVALFPDLVETPVPLDLRGTLAREWAEELMGSLERRGHRPRHQPFELPVAEADPAAPPPNFVPPEVMEELERAAPTALDPGVAEALEDARRVRFEGAARGSDNPPR